MNLQSETFDIDIFATKIYKARYNKSIKDIESVLFEVVNFDQVLKNNQGSMRGNGICSYVHKRDLQYDPRFSDVVEFITDSCKEYWKNCGFNSKYIPIIKEMWFNIYNMDSHIDLHNHSPMVTTCSFYIKKQLNNSNLVFENPLSTLLKHQPYSIDKETYHTLFENEINAETGDIVLFPGWLNHKTLPNKSTEQRIMIGANICSGV
jgi:uncharacterized protein (TIGR02466 family)